MKRMSVIMIASLSATGTTAIAQSDPVPEKTETSMCLTRNAQVMNP